MIGAPGSVTTVLEANPGLKGKIGFFAVPGKTAKTPGAVFTGGSDLIIPERAGHQDTAYDVVKTLTGEEWQRKLSKAMSCVPNKVTFATTIDDPGVEVMTEGAANGRATPNSAQWAAVEEARLIKTYQAQVLTGEEKLEDAAQAASQAITAALDE
jgi:N,N'-diacetylchitobiose transport system substrate-binding protein